MTTDGSGNDAAFVNTQRETSNKNELSEKIPKARFDSFGALVMRSLADDVDLIVNQIKWLKMGV